MYVATGEFTRVKGPSKYLDEQPLCLQKVDENFSYEQYSKEGGSRFKKTKDYTFGKFLQKAQSKEEIIKVYSI